MSSPAARSEAAGLLDVLGCAVSARDEPLLGREPHVLVVDHDEDLADGVHRLVLIVDPRAYDPQLEAASAAQRSGRCGRRRLSRPDLGASVS